MPWNRYPAPSYLNSLIVNGGGIVIQNGSLFVDSTFDPGILYYDVSGLGTRTTQGLQVAPRMAASTTWTTPATGPLQMTFAEYPGGFIHWTGQISSTSTVDRADGTYCMDITLTAFAGRFKPLQEIHCLADGRDKANNNQPVFVLGIDGFIHCFNLDNTSAGTVSYYLNTVYNKFTTPGKYENTGGGPV